VFRRAFKSPGGAIGNSSKGVAQKFTFLVHTGNYNATGLECGWGGQPAVCARQIR
jgi:hypothetical protein